MQYRKKPVVIEAWEVGKLLAFDDIGKGLPEVIQDAKAKRTIEFKMTEIWIHTLEGVMRAQPDDWLIQGVQGEFYPCKPDIFDATYELVLLA